VKEAPAKADEATLVADRPVGLIPIRPPPCTDFPQSSKTLFSVIKYVTEPQRLVQFDSIIIHL
jgi:hypothetical protein